MGSKNSPDVFGIGDKDSGIRFDDRKISKSEVLRVVSKWLEEDGWEIAGVVKYGTKVDIYAQKDDVIWLIEAKGATKSCDVELDAAFGRLLKSWGPPRGGADRRSIAIPAFKGYADPLKEYRGSLIFQVANISLLVVHEGEVEHIPPPAILGFARAL